METFFPCNFLLPAKAFCTLGSIDSLIKFLVKWFAPGQHCFKICKETYQNLILFMHWIQIFSPYSTIHNVQHLGKIPEREIFSQLIYHPRNMMLKSFVTELFHERGSGRIINNSREFLDVSIFFSLELQVNQIRKNEEEARRMVTKGIHDDFSRKLLFSVFAMLSGMYNVIII